MTESESLVKQPIVWVDNDRELDELCERWQSLPLLAVDTEFVRTRTYYPIAGLIQINDGQSNYLIDPQKIQDFYPLIELFDAYTPVKALHSCSEDLEVFHRLFGCLPKGIFDTQVAGAFCGYGVSVGFANMVNAVIGVELPKGETRSDWLARPLSQSQVQYAALDVEYLFRLSAQLLVALQENKRLVWAMEDSAALAQNFFDNQKPERALSRFRSAWKLSPRQLLALMRLTQWRENLAQEKNVPRNRIVKDAALYGIVQTMPTDPNQLKNFEGFTDRMLRQHGRDIIAELEVARTAAEESLPQTLASPLKSAERKFVDALKAKVTGFAEEKGLPAELLLKKRDYENIAVEARNGTGLQLDSLGQWRCDLLMSLLSSHVSENYNR